MKRTKRINAEGDKNIHQSCHSIKHQKAQIPAEENWEKGTIPLSLMHSLQVEQLVPFK